MAYRILSLDGGGAWALIEVLALMDLYGDDTPGHEVLQQFDLVAANSGGSLVLGGLVENYRLSEILSLFKDDAKRQAIFSPTHSLADKILHGITDLVNAGMGPKYNEEAKLPAIEMLLPKSGNKPLRDVAQGIHGHSGEDVHLLVIGFDYDRNRAKFFRSKPAGQAGGALGEGAPSDLTLAEAIHASTNAPINYFDGPARYHSRNDRYWDGGITGCNNPVLAAVTEAICLQKAPSDIVALSIGTGTVALPLAQPDQPKSPFYQPRSDTGLLADVGKLAAAILDDPPDMASFFAHVMTGAPAEFNADASSRIVRMNPLVSPLGTEGAWTPPGGFSLNQFGFLQNINMDAVKPIEISYIDSFARAWIAGEARNQPIRMNGDTLQLELGDRWFADAKSHWRDLAPRDAVAPGAGAGV